MREDHATDSRPIPVAPAPSRYSSLQWDRWTAIMATIVAICALGVSWYTAILQNAQVKAQTWPYLQLWNSSAELSWSLSNRGVGPARVRDVKIRVDGVEVANFGEAFLKLSGRPLECAKQSYFARRVIAANEDVTLIQFCNSADFDVFAQADKRMLRQICYCSLLDDCTLIDEGATNEAQYQQSVSSCPQGEEGRFR